MPVTPSPDSPPDATAAFAAFISGCARRTLPATVGAATGRIIANWMACALGAGDESVEQVTRVAGKLSGAGQSSIIGGHGRMDCVNAALVNGFRANALDFDDMHVPTLIHPSVPVVAAALALAEDRGSSGTALLAATATGIEVECRLGLALFPMHYDMGWHSTATLGTLGAAAAAASIIGLDTTRVAHALGIAATQAGGLRAMLPNPCKSFNTGRAAAAGVLSALLAEAGLESDPHVLDAKFGLFHVLGPPRDARALVDQLGVDYLVSSVSLKPYPCGVVIHPLIDACLALSGASGISAGRVVALSAAVHPRALELAGRRHPETAILGRFSLYQAAALAIARQAAGLAQFEAAAVDDVELHRLRACMSIEPDSALTPGAARVSVQLADGSRVERSVESPSGSPERPLTTAQLRAKFMELALRTIDALHAAPLFDACLALNQVADVSSLRRHWDGDRSVAGAG